MSARDVSRAGLELDNFIQNSAEGGMDDGDWAEFARRTIDLAKAEMREEIRVMPAYDGPAPSSKPVAPQRRYTIELEILHPNDRDTTLQSLVIGSHATEQDARDVCRILNAILGSLYIFTINEV